MNRVVFAAIAIAVIALGYVVIDSGALVGVLALPPLILVILAAAHRRCEHMGLPGWLSLTLLIPLFNVGALAALCAAPEGSAAGPWRRRPRPFWRH